MEENKESSPGVIENLALVTDAIQTMFPDGKIICVYELNEDDYKKVQVNFRKIDNTHNRFSVNISGLEHVFISEKYKEEPPKVTLDKEQPKTIGGKLSSWFKGGGGPVE